MLDFLQTAVEDSCEGLMIKVQPPPAAGRPWMASSGRRTRCALVEQKPAYVGAPDISESVTYVGAPDISESVTYVGAPDISESVINVGAPDISESVTCADHAMRSDQ